MKKATKEEKENAEDFIFNCVENRGAPSDSWALAQWLVGIMPAEAVKTLSDQHKKENA